MTSLTFSLAALPEPGGYIHPVKVVAFFVLLVPWLWASAWIDKDTIHVKAQRILWTPLFFGGGLLCILIWLLVPIYWAGLGLYIVLIPTVGAIYIVHRNTRVVPEARVLTQEHLSGLFSGGKKDKTAIVTRLKLYGPNGKPVTPPAEGEPEEKQIYNHTQDLLYDIMWRRASVVDISPASSASAVTYVIDGVPIKRPPIDRTVGEGVINYIKAIAEMDVADRRKPQTGRITVDLANQPVEISVTTAGSTSGQRLQLRVLQEAVRTRLGELGFAQDTLQRLRALNSLEDGLVIVSAKHSNGLTSTLYSLLRDNDAYVKLLSTVEAKSEVDLENISQHTYKSAEEMPRILAGVMRRDPDVVIVDTCTDQSGAETIIEAANHKRILLGLMARDSFTSLAKWAKLAGSAAKAVQPLRAVLCQVLMRKLCLKCREAYRPDAEMLRKANLPANKISRFYRPPTKPLTDEKGNPIICDSCQGTGYVGRTAAFELLEITDELRQLIASGANLTQIKAAARKNKMFYLQEAALRQVMEGVTSIQEVIRVTRTKEDKR